jgi:hypothetical protein
MVYVRIVGGFIKIVKFANINQKEIPLVSQLNLFAHISILFSELQQD